MTRMSEPDAVRLAEITHNHARSQVPSPLAHGVHDVAALVERLSLLALFGLAGGCVIPPSLSVDNQDGGVNSPPAILAVRTDQQELPEPGPVIFDRGITAGKINMTLLDTDVEDTLFVRIFLDYSVTNANPARVTCTAPPPTPRAAQRSITCDATSLCPPMGDGPFNMSVVVFDREPLDSGTPAYQAMPPGGLKTSVFYFLKCQDAQ